MSRSNPNKAKQRSTKSTVLFYGEGFNECIFLKYLRSIYTFNTGLSVKIKNGKGGSPQSIITKAKNEIADFDKIIILLDSDRITNSDRLSVKNYNIEIIENNPCLEATLLSILNSKKDYSIEKSSWCKKEFQNNYGKSLNIRDYERILPKEKINKIKKEVIELNQIIQAITSLH